MAEVQITAEVVLVWGYKRENVQCNAQVTVTLVSTGSLCSAMGSPSAEQLGHEYVESGQVGESFKKFISKRKAKDCLLIFRW